MDKKQKYMAYTGMPCRFIWFEQSFALGHGAPRVARSVGMSGSEVRNARPCVSGGTPRFNF